MTPDHPLRLLPVFRSYLWGGQRLQRLLAKKVPGAGIWAESWEVVDRGHDQSVVADGDFCGWTLRQLVESFPEKMLGTAASQGSFPLLLKYLDCQRVLSVQVHPDDAYASRMNPPDLGKTEAWYVLHADPGSVIYAGLKQGVDRDSLRKAIDAGQTESCLHPLHASPGDCIFIPAGTVHALGEGLVVAEIQQASDTTFRLYDWNRVDAVGNPRPLHIHRAMDVIDFDAAPVEIQKPRRSNPGEIRNLVSCDKFFLDELTSKCSYLFPHDHRFRILTIPRGNAELQFGAHIMGLHVGDSILIPAVHVDCRLQMASDGLALIAGLP